MFSFTVIFHAFARGVGAPSIHINHLIIITGSLAAIPRRYVMWCLRPVL